MNSEEARAFCNAYLDGQLDAKTKDEIDRLLAGDASLAAYYEEQREFHALLNARVKEVATPADLEDGIRARLRAVQSKRSNVIPFPEKKPTPSRRRSKAPSMCWASRQRRQSCRRSAGCWAHPH